MKTCVIDVGGGFRGIYATGILDYCQDNAITFDLGIGISAGSANIASFMSRQRGRNYVFYTEYSFRRQYASLRNFLFKKSYIDMDYVYGTLSNHDGENPLDYQAIADNPMGFCIIATDAETGQPRYFFKDALTQDHYDVFKASSSIPFVCKPYPIDGRLYFDGALGDPVPVQKAFDLGCDKVVLILTKPADKPREVGSDAKLASLIQKKYPQAAEQFRLRAEHYNDGVALAKSYAKQGKLLILSPENTFGVDTLHKDKASLNQLYESGMRDGEKLNAFFHLSSSPCAAY